MIAFYLNGEARECASNTRLSDLLAHEIAAGRRVAVECNGEIIPRSQYAHTEIAEQDHLEIVIAVGGG